MTRERIPRGFGVRALALLTLICVSGSCASERGEEPEALKSALEAENVRFSEAFSHRDPAAMALLYAEDGQAFPPGAQPVTGRSAIREMWKVVLGFPVGRIQLETVEVDGNPATAWETGRYTMIGTDGSTMDVGKYVVIWKRDQTGWKIYRDMWSSNNPPQPSAAGGPAPERHAKP